MRDDLHPLAARILTVTTSGRRFKVSAGPDFDLLRSLTRAELQELAAVAHCNVVVRLGGAAFEFTHSGALSSDLPVPS